MASLSTSKSGVQRIVFTDRDGRRRKIHLGKVAKSIGEEVRSRVSQIIAARDWAGSLDAPTVRWLGEIGDKLHARLAKVGLVESRVPVEVPPAAPTRDIHQ